MSEKKKRELEESKKQFDKIVRVCLIGGIIVVSGFIIYYILIPKDGYVTFGILNSDKKGENYPTQAYLGENIDFYVTVENHMGTQFIFRLKIYKGNNDTQLSSSGSRDAELNITTPKITLDNTGKWMSEKLSLSFYTIGSNQIIIVELWQFVDQTTDEFFDILWLRLNITA